MVGHSFPEAYTRDNLDQILDANDAFPEYMGETERDRIITLARQRADARGSSLEDGTCECLLATDWGSFATNEFGFDGDSMNQAALGVLNIDVSSSREASLFEDTVVVQDGWLRTGDGRKTQIEPYMDEDYDGATEGSLWVPDGAAQYICIVELTNDLIHDAPDASDAM